MTQTKTIFDSTFGQEVLDYIKTETFYHQRGAAGYSNAPHVLKKLGGFTEIIDVPVQLVTLFSKGQLANKKPCGDIDEFLKTAAGLIFVLPHIRDTKPIGELRADIDSEGKLTNVHYIDIQDLLMIDANEKMSQERQKAVEREEKKKEHFTDEFTLFSVNSTFELLARLYAEDIPYPQDLAAPRGVFVREDGTFTVRYEDSVNVGMFQTYEQAVENIWNWIMALPKSDLNE